MLGGESSSPGSSCAVWQMGWVNTYVHLMFLDGKTWKINVCMYLSVYTNIYNHTYVYIYTCLHTYIYIHVYIYIYVCVCVTHMYIYVYIYVYMCDGRKTLYKVWSYTAQVSLFNFPYRFTQSGHPFLERINPPA